MNNFTITGATLYTDFFTRYNGKIHDVLAGDCSDMLGLYRADGRDLGNGYCFPVFNCIMENLDEGTRAAMAATAVLLGLMPSILSNLGNTTAETSMLSVWRPLLALCLAFGSPLASPLRPLESIDRTVSWRENTNRNTNNPKATYWKYRTAIVAVEYVVVFAAIVNNILMALAICHSTVNLLASCNVRYLPLLWALVGGGVHLCAALGIRSRAWIERTGFKQHKDSHLRNDKMSAALRTNTHVISSSLWADQRGFLVWKRDSIIDSTVMFITSIFVVVHLIFGTAVFSAIYLVGVQDALVILVRFAASAVVCRLIQVFEMGMMAGALVLKDDSNMVEHT